MEIKWVKTFLVAAKYENFRRTSEELYLTQPAITKHIKRLEDFLQVELFRREGKRISLTEAGHQFRKYAKEIVSAYEEGMAGFHSWKQGYNQKVVLAVAPQIAASILPPILRGFMKEHPTIEVIIHIVNSYDIGVEISNGRADVGLSRIKPIQSHLSFEIIHKERVVFVAPRGEMGKDTNLNENVLLEQYRLITHNYSEYWDELLSEIKHRYPFVQTMTVNQVEVTKRFIEQGLGVSYLPLSMVKDEIKEQKMVECTSDTITPPSSVTYLITKFETNEAALFAKFIKETFT